METEQQSIDGDTYPRHERGRRRHERGDERHDRDDRPQEGHAARPAKRDVPVPNDLPWYALSGAVVVGAALLSYGMVLTIRRMARDLRASATKEARAGVIATLVSIGVASALGALVGYLTWHWALGFVSAVVGAWASPWVIDTVSGLVSRWKK